MLSVLLMKESPLLLSVIDASETTLLATLNQGGRPVSFMSRALQGSEIHYPPVEKKSTALMEAIRKWEHLLARQHITIISDQRYVALSYIIVSEPE